MTREIRFRAWDELNRVMMEPGSVDLFVHFDGKLNHHDLGIIQGTENTPQMTLMQYTGLKDKNGKEIYEGDIIILKINDYGNWIWGKYAVYYDQGKVGFRLKNGDEEWSFTSANDIEVIGNIYESEVNTHENNSNSPHHSTTQSKAEETADEGGLQA